MNPFGNRPPGPFGGAPYGSGYGGPSSTVGPQGSGGGGALGVVGGRAYDPKPPPDFIGMVRAWAKGKAWRRSAGETVSLPWVAIDLIDVEADRCIYPVDDVGQRQADDLSHDIWERAKGWVRMSRETRPRSFVVRCRFADAEGRETFEEWPIVVALPPEDQQFGQHVSPHLQRYSGGSMMSRYGGSPAPHITSQEIDLMAMTMGMMRDLQQSYREDKAADRAMIAGFQARELQSIELLRSLHNDAAENARKQFWEAGKLAAMKMIAERFAKIGPVLGIQLSQVANRYMGGGRKKTEREELAFETLRRIFKAAKKSGADSPEQLFGMLQAMGLDEEQLDDVKNLLMEIHADETRKELEKEAASIGDPKLEVPEGANDAEGDEEDGPLNGDEDQ